VEIPPVPHSSECIKIGKPTVFHLTAYPAFKPDRISERNSSDEENVAGEGLLLYATYVLVNAEAV
jgi:uncharacterized Fe-S cluster protein YjdI